MGRSIGSFVVQFGMVSIPTALHNVATPSESKLGLNQLHGDGCHKRLNQVMVCRNHETPVEVPRDKIVKGYEYAKDQYVLVTDDDMASLPLASKNTLAITSFCEAAELDPAVFEKSYYLEPTKGGEKAYALLTRALQADKLAAIASITVRKKEQLCALRAADDRLFVHPLFYSGEMQYEGPGRLAAVSDKELEVARMLTQALRKPFDAEEHVDAYAQAFEAMIARKLDPETADQPAPVPAQPKQESQDLMAMLQASIGAAKEPRLNVTTQKKGEPKKAKRAKAGA